jgi:5-methylcytosine-specific restriction endonuclease McrA
VDDKEYQRQYQLAKYRRWMKEAREKLGGRCVICGTTENLEFDHIDPGTKSFSLGGRRPNRAAWDTEVAKCQLLCYEHHKEKTSREQRKEVHGTWGMYKKKCRCEECREFVRTYMREYKRAKRAKLR